MTDIISFQNIIFLCGGLTLIYSLFPLKSRKKRTLEYYVTHYSAGLAIATAVGIILMIVNYEGVKIPITVSFKDIKIFLPMLAIILIVGSKNILDRVRSN